jgi:hypothetical protein
VRIRDRRYIRLRPDGLVYAGADRQPAYRFGSSRPRTRGPLSPEWSKSPDRKDPTRARALQLEHG